MLILYRLKLYQFDPELPSALNMLAVAVQSNICFSFLLLLLFYFFSCPPTSPKEQLLLCRVSAGLTCRGGCRFPGGEMHLRDTLSVAHPGLAHTRSPGITPGLLAFFRPLCHPSLPTGAPSPHLLMHYFPKSSV